MSGIEIVAGIVAGIAAVVSAFNGCVTQYRSWREKRRERLKNAQNKKLERSLKIGGPLYSGNTTPISQGWGGSLQLVTVCTFT
jgi:hypothetical protein